MTGSPKTQSICQYALRFMAIIFFLSGMATGASLRGQETADLFIKNGSVMDGTGNSWVYSDIVINNGKITRMGRNIQVTATRVIDANGLIVASGFIDVHTHIEGEEGKTPGADNFIYDGVITVVTGNCGASVVDVTTYFRFL